MKLFRILEKNGAPKASWVHTVTFLLAKDAMAVYFWLDEACDCGWEDQFEDDEWYTIYDECNHAIGEVTSRDKIIHECGQLDDEDDAWSDAYYGVSLFGWEPVEVEITDELLATLNEVGMLKVSNG